MEVRVGKWDSRDFKMAFLILSVLPYSITLINEFVNFQPVPKELWEKVLQFRYPRY